MRAHIEKSRKDAQDNDHGVQPIACNKGKGHVVPNDVDTPTDDELSSGSSPSLNLSLAKSTWERTRTKSRKRPSPHSAFSDVVSGAFCRARKEATRKQYPPGQALENPSVLPSSKMPPVQPAHHAFGRVSFGDPMTCSLHP